MSEFNLDYIEDEASNLQEEVDRLKEIIYDLQSELEHTRSLLLDVWNADENSAFDDAITNIEDYFQRRVD